MADRASLLSGAAIFVLGIAVFAVSLLTAVLSQAVAGEVPTKVADAASAGGRSDPVAEVPAPTEPDPPAGEQQAVAAPVDSGAVPLRVRIPGIAVDADVIDLGVTSDGTLEVPEDFSQVGWYTGRATPGDVGPSVVVGHVDSWEGPAVFYRLSDLEAGDIVEIDRSDGTVARFEVVSLAWAEKSDFPTERVYGATEEPTLRLVTCGGEFDPDAKSYLSNLIVFAEHLGNEPAAS